MSTRNSIQQWGVFNRNRRVVSASLSEGNDEKITVCTKLLGNSLEQKKERIAFFSRNEIKEGKFLGKGAFSKVYAISDIKLKKKKNDSPQATEESAVRLSKKDAHHANRYAIKYLRNSTLSNNKKLSFAACDIINEARFLSLLDHEGIIKIHGITGIDRRIGGLEYTKGGKIDGFGLIIDQVHDTLEHKLLQWKTSQSQEHEILLRKKSFTSLQIAEALAYMHERRIIYRDLKPQNIGFQKDGSVTIFDFGCCKELPQPQVRVASEEDDECYKLSIAGSVRYIAPEMLTTSRYNTKVDVFGWAILYHQMLSLATPFPEYKNIKQYKKFVAVLGERPEISGLGLSNDMEELIKGAWAQCVRERFSMREVVQKLKHILEDSTE